MKSLSPNFIINMLKSFIVLFSGSVVFVGVFIVLALIGSGNVEDFPLKQVIIENLELLIPLGITCMITAPIYSYFLTDTKPKRLLRLFMLDILFCWLAIIITMIAFSEGAVINDIGSLLGISIYMLIAMSIFAAPIIVPATFILNKWAKKSNLQN